MEKKTTKKAVKTTVKTKSPKKSATKKKVNELPILAPETTPSPYVDIKVENKVSFLDKIKKFLGF
jgi:aspartate carbamoyltransferase regulatory subunit